MTRPPASPPRRRIPYAASMAVTTLLLGGITVAFVLIVLPRRFVLQGDLRESGVSFPALSLPFQPGKVTMRAPRVVRVVEAPQEGPAERLWNEVLPLLDAGEYERAVPVFLKYLADYPDDASVRLEYGIALVRAGRSGAAEEAFRAVLNNSNNARARIELARLLVARGETEEALEIVAPIAAEAPEAREAAAVAREILAALPEAPAEPSEEVAPPTVPAEGGAPERTAAVVLSGDPLQDARSAVERGDMVQARALYLEALREYSDDPPLLLEWADVLQYRMEDLVGALDILQLRASMTGVAPEERFRIAQLEVWTGAEADAEPDLIATLADDPDHAGAWALLGDIRRWNGLRAAAGNAYDRALALDPEEPVALAGRQLLREDTERAVAEVDSRRLGPSLEIFRDSDGFERAEASAYGSLLPFPEVVEVEVGVRRLRGSDAVGEQGVDEGARVEATVARWWREGQLRGSFTLGVEDSSLGETEAILGARLQARDVRGWNLDASFRSGPGHYLTSTLQSVDAGVRSDQLGITFYHVLPYRWELSGAVEGVSLRGGGADALRFASGVSVSRALSPWFRTGVSSRYIGYSAGAPVSGDRRLFWDPKLFWSTGILFELRTPPRESDGLSAYFRATPGFAFAEERDAVSRQWVRQLETQGGIRYQRRSLAIVVDGLFTRGREGGYTSRGLTIGLEVAR